MTRIADQLTCWAVTAPGVELLAAEELRALGIVPGVVEPGGVEFVASYAQLVQSLLWLRTANRVTVRIAEFRAAAFGELERHALTIPWGRWIPEGAAVHFRVTSKKSKLYHQDAIAERLERAVLSGVKGTSAVRTPSAAEALEDEVTKLPGVQRVVVRASRDIFTLSIDAAGALLHRRGYRQEVAKAPLRETLAAAMLLGCGWDGSLPLHDPMCGSGTIAIEAALIARRIAPGLHRRFAAEAWPSLPPSVWGMGRAEAKAQAVASDVQIVGSDRDDGAIAAAHSNAERAGVSDAVEFVRATISDMAPHDGEGWLITNPPYGARIGDRTALRDLYAVLGRMIRERRPHWHFGMLSADRMLEQQMGLPLVEVLRTNNGGIPVHVVARMMDDGVDRAPPM
jgi:putative N6-adenine-specific DNA methylase